VIADENTPLGQGTSSQRATLCLFLTARRCVGQHKNVWIDYCRYLKEASPSSTRIDVFYKRAIREQCPYSVVWIALILIAVTAVWAIPRNACAQLYIAQQGAGERSGVVREYDASTGAVINARFITGLQQPVALALSDDDLFVANMGGSVGKYNAATKV
jgi:hypothetical protein